jgi:hypothetical protein
MLPVHVEESPICVGDRFSVFFLRTLRIPEDGEDPYPLPPGLGEFPIHRVEDYAGSVPEDEWSGWSLHSLVSAGSIVARVRSRNVETERGESGGRKRQRGVGGGLG